MGMEEPIVRQSKAEEEEKSKANNFFWRYFSARAFLWPSAY